ncbi:CaiB/BaiF CoA transferase family protein [Caballeronia sp. 15711]|uniref:CaiB/BaiF CoA transferase family protein n=1 Tax=Caballeronia sp. 15711 TaxID=3391029 RepID=UPI0039E29EDE
MKALSNIVMLDFTHMLSGPYGTMLLADLGAQTIKIEPPGAGEGTRKLLADDPDYSINGMGAYFLTLNRNKRSVCIDLKSERGRALMLELVRHADVVFDNFSSGVMSRLGLGHQDLAKINPRIVTCSVTGFGSSGPAQHRPAFDLVAQGIGGGMSITGEEGGRPIRAGIPIGDLGGGIFGALGVLAALMARHETGRGQHVDVSMLDCQISMLNYMATMYAMSGKNPEPLGNRHFVHVPYDAFRTSTRYLIIAILTDKFWESLIDLLGIEELNDPAYKTQPGRYAARDRINELVQRRFETNTCEYWLEQLAARRIPCAPVNDFEHVLSDPQVRSRNMVVPVRAPDGRMVEMPGNPVKLSETDEESFSPPPAIGEHTAEVLAHYLKLSEADLAALARDGVIQ